MRFSVERLPRSHTQTFASASFAFLYLILLPSATMGFHSAITSSIASLCQKPTTPITLHHHSKTNNDEKEQHLVLIGGGHAHVQVIRALHARPPSLRVTLIDQQSHATYSGMVPGCIAGIYKDVRETQIDIKALAEWAGIAFLQDTVVDIDLDQKLVYLQSTASAVPFDVVSLDIGSTTRGWDDCPGAADWTIPTRPIHELVERLSVQSPKQLVVLGGGLAGLELSLAAKGRWPDCECVVLDAADEILPGEVASVRATVRDVLREKDVEIRHRCRAERVEDGKLYLENNKSDGHEDTIVPFSHCIWATGAGAPALLHRLHAERGLACDHHGWVQVSSTLQSTSHPHVFAAGDCASVGAPKAGVYAVRAGPTLLTNLTRYLRHLFQKGNDDNDDLQPTATKPLVPYEPQDDFMKLVVCGDGTALGIRFGLAMRGRWVFRLKDAIDNDFLELFRVVEGEDAPPPPPENTSDEDRYKIAQYDDNEESQKPIEMEPSEALGLLLRTDDDVDFRVAQRVLKRMNQDEEYRTAVLESTAAVSASY